MPTTIATKVLRILSQHFFSYLSCIMIDNFLVRTWTVISFKKNNSTSGTDGDGGSDLGGLVLH